MSKIIKAVFTGRFCKTPRVFRFDTDDKLQIVNVNLPANYTVDFSNSKTGDSVPVLATSDTVQIPPDLFVPGSEIYAWIWLSDSNGGHTRCEATIPIDPRARRTGTEPTPAQASAWDEAVDTLNETIKGIPAVVNSALAEAKESGEFDGTDGSGMWYTTARVSGSENPFVRRRGLIGREGATVQVHDLLIAPDVGDEGEPTTLYEITSVGAACALKRLCKMQGEDGTSPSVTTTEITGGHRITITDEAHPEGQSFDVMDGQGGSGTVDDDFSTTSENPVQNKVITNALNQAATQLRNLGLALDDKVNKVNGKGLSTNDFTDSDKAKLDDAASETWVTQQGYITDVELGSYRTAADQDVIDRQQNAAIAAKYTKPASGIPKTDMAEDVQTSLGKADTALQQHQDISGKLDKAQGAANAGKFLVVGNDGNITLQTMTNAETEAL